MRIAIVCDGAGTIRGGIEFHASRLLAALARLGTTARIFARDELRDLRLADYDALFVEGVVRGTLLRLRLKPGWGDIRKVLFTHGSFFAETHLRQLIDRAPPWLLVPSLLRKVSDASLGRPIFRDFTAIVTLTDSEVRDVRHISGRLPSGIFALPLLGANNPAAVTRIVPPARWSAYAPYVCAVARVDPRKNFLSVVRALRGTRYSFILAGQDGGALRPILEYVKRNKIQNFAYLGPVAELTRVELFAGALATILPSYFEGLPYMVLDSLSLGVPCIMTLNSYMPREPGVVFCSPNEVGIRTAVEQVSRSPPSVGGAVAVDDTAVVQRVLEFVSAAAE